MSQIIRTLDQLLAELPDNTSRLISPMVTRDMTISLWPALETRDPTPDDDNSNQSGAGFFDRGSSWINTTTKTFWRCFGGDHSAADWRQVYPAVLPPPPPGVGVFLARLTNVQVPCPALQTTVATVWGSNTNLVVLSNPADMVFIGNAMEMQFGGMRTDGFVLRKDDGGTSVFLDNESTLPGGQPSTVCVPQCAEWIEQQRDATTGQMGDKPGGLVGTASTAPAFSMSNPTYFGQQEDYVWIRPAGTASGLPIYDFVEIDDGKDGEFESITVTKDHITETTISDDTVQTTQVKVVTVGVSQSIQFTPQATPPPYPNSLYVDVNGDLEYNDSSGNPTPVGTGSTWVKYEIDYTQAVFNTGVPGVITPQWWIVLATLPATRAILRLVGKSTILWSGGPTIAVSLYSSLLGSVVPVSNIPNAPNPPFPVAGQGTQYAYMQTRANATFMVETDGTYQLVLFLGGSLGSPYTSGHSRLYVEYGSFSP